MTFRRTKLSLRALRTRRASHAIWRAALVVAHVVLVPAHALSAADAAVVSSAPQAVITTKGGVLAHAFAGEFLVVQSPRAISLYRQRDDGLVDTSPVDVLHLTGSLVTPLSKMKIVPVSMRRIRCTRRDVKHVVAVAGVEGTTCVVAITTDGTLKLLAKIQLLNSDVTWPLWGHDGRGRLLLAGSSHTGALSWGVAVIRCDEIVVCESPVDSLNLPPGARNISGQFTPAGDHALLRIASDRRSEGDLSITQVFDLPNQGELITESHLVLHGTESGLSRDGRALLNLVDLSDRTLVSVRYLEDGKVSKAENATLPAIDEFECFDLPGNHVVFRNAAHALACYTLPSNGRMRLVDDLAISGCRHRHVEESGPRWYLFKTETLDIVSLDEEGRFHVASRPLGDARASLGFIGNVDVDPWGRLCAITAPDSSLIGVFEVLDRAVPVVYAPTPGTREAWLGFAPGARWGLVGTGSERFRGSTLPERIAFVPLPHPPASR